MGMEDLRIDVKSMSAPERQLQDLLRQFVAGPDRSMAFANVIEDFVLDQFPDEGRFMDLVYALATYRPEGGQYLYNEQDMLKKCEAYLTCWKV